MERENWRKEELKRKFPGLVVPSGDVMKKITMNIDEAIKALQKAKQEVGNATLILVLPDHGLATNVVDLVANKGDESVRVIVRLYGDKTNDTPRLVGA